MYQITEFLATTVIAVVAARFVRILPSIVVAIIVGIVVGAGVFSLGMDGYGVEALSNVGLFAIFFEVGLDFDLTAPELTSTTPVRSATSGVFASMILVSLAVFALGHTWQSAALVGLATVSTSVSVSVYSFRSLGPLRHLEAKVAVMAGLFDDMLGLVAIALVATVLSHSLGSLIPLVVSVVVVIVSFVLKRRTADRSFELGRTRRYSLVLTLIIVMIVLWREFGLTLAVAGFVAGAFSGPVLTREDQLTLSKISSFLAPFFLVSIGLLVSFRHGVSLIDVAGIAVLSAALICAKWANALTVGAEVRDRVLYWFSMVPRAEVAGIGLVLIEPRIPSSLELQAVLAVVITSVLAPFVIVRRARKANPTEES